MTHFPACGVALARRSIARENSGPSAPNVIIQISASMAAGSFGAESAIFEEPTKIPPGVERLFLLDLLKQRLIPTSRLVQIRGFVGGSDLKSGRECRPVADVDIPAAGRKGKLPVVRAVEIDEGDRTFLRAPVHQVECQP